MKDNRRVVLLGNVLVNVARSYERRQALRIQTCCTASGAHLTWVLPGAGGILMHTAEESALTRVRNRATLGRCHVEILDGIIEMEPYLYCKRVVSTPQVPDPY